MLLLSLSTYKFHFCLVYLYFISKMRRLLNIVSILAVNLDKASKQEITTLERSSSKTPTL